MSPLSKREYLEAIITRYKQASRTARRAIITEICNVCKYHRKHAIRLLSTFKRFTRPHPNKRGPQSRYDISAVILPLKRIWLAANQPCSKRLHAILPLWIPAYTQEYGKLSHTIITKLRTISSSTIDRIFKPIRIRYKGRGRSTTKPGSLLRKQIPIKTNQWNESIPGFVEADTVAHCGESTAGMYANTIDLTDIPTGWTEQRAVWGKGEHGVLLQIKDIEYSLPFPLRGFDSDNGSEFLNYHLFRHFTQRTQPIQFTRSRAYHKNDNAHIEQKNWTHVRQWIGYQRLENPEVVPLLNNLYTTEWRLFHNFFCPSVKLIQKKRIGSKIKKIHDSPKTPYQRILTSTHVSQHTKQQLTRTFNSLNPFTLRNAIELKLKKIFATIRSAH